MTIDATSGAVSSHIHYDAFGNVKHETGTFSPTYTFSTKEFLEDVALYLYAYRVYDPISGRWTQRDPIDYQDSINLYQFCGNNPVNAFDVDGRKLIWASDTLKAIYDDICSKSEYFKKRMEDLDGKDYDVTIKLLGEDSSKGSSTATDLEKEKLYVLITQQDVIYLTVEGKEAIASMRRQLIHELYHMLFFKKGEEFIIKMTNEALRKYGDPEETMRDPSSHRYIPIKERNNDPDDPDKDMYFDE